MDIAISGRNTNVSDVLRSTVESKVSKLGRFLDGMERAEVYFSEERNPRIAEREVCEITMEGRGQVVRAKAAAEDNFAAVERVVTKLEHRLVKLKGRRVSRSHPRRNGSPVAAQAGAGAEIDDEPSPSEPRIIKTKQFDIKPMTPEEAVLQMELLGHDFFLFTNAESSRAAVVYRRRDGDYGLIDAS